MQSPPRNSRKRISERCCSLLICGDPKPLQRGTSFAQIEKKLHGSRRTPSYPVGWRPPTRIKRIPGLPCKMGCDGGHWTPHYAQSNVHAEAAGKAMKALVEKTAPKGDLDEQIFREGLLLRNTPRGNGLSPAQMVVGHPIRSPVPAHQSSFGPQWQKPFEDAKESACESGGIGKRPLQPTSTRPTSSAARIRYTYPRPVHQKMDETRDRNQLWTSPGLPSPPAER